jgi:hypothetical protein
MIEDICLSQPSKSKYSSDYIVGQRHIFALQNRLGQ